MMGITGAFSSLGINERPRVPQDKSGNVKFPKNCSTVSLPNMVLSEKSSISPSFIRNVCEDESEASEQPIDFSKKYCETKDKVSGSGCTFNNVVKSYNNSFTIYAETDLDQPTDYSLRYAEDDSDSDRKPKTEGTEFVQDTIKTYCTEDTPYETPFNFSTSTSMSDLRIDDKASIENKLDVTDTKNTDVTVLPIKEIARVHRSKIKSEFSSGLMSPEKPVNYCDEGTPGYFSRVPSCGSLNSIPVSDPTKTEPKEESLRSDKKEIRRVNKFPAETKAVKFEEVVNYAEETPLMFSRSSSLASLDSIEQHSIHDDRSSVVSDFSRLTSGVISPSELPDSPSQTVPPSPKPKKNPITFPKKKTEEAQSVPKSSVFEDVVKKFKMESTPLHFSAATSLSSLIDDEIDLKVAHKQTDAAQKEDLDLSENSEDEDILAACINIGMQSTRYRQPKAGSSLSKDISLPETLKNSFQYLPIAVQVSSSENDLVQKSDVTSDSLRTYCTEGTPAILSHAGSNSDLSILSIHGNEKSKNKDSVEIEKAELIDSQSGDLQVGHTEETSAHEKQNGDLNISLEIETNRNQSRRSSFSSLSDDSHESEQALLQECILAGMPKGNSPSKSTVPIITGSSDEQNESDIKHKNEIAESDLSDEETDILADCINIGIKNNRYTHSKLNPEYKPLNPNDVVSDSVRSYCTEDTPAILSHAGSCSNLSVLSVQGNEDEKDYFSDCDSSDEDGEKLLEECVKYGMVAMAERVKSSDNHTLREGLENRSETRDDKDLGFRPDGEDSASISSLSDDYEAEQALLQQCIQAGMPKSSKPNLDDSGDLTRAEKALLQQCILEGMKKCRAVPKKPSEDDPSELSEAEQALLRQCILSGMPKNKNLTQGGPSGSRESTELTESERLLLQQCILAGMPKSRKVGNGRESGSRQWMKRAKEVEKGAEHTCCIHCPRNRAGRKNGHGKGRRYRERVVQVRESREILYVTSQILTMKKEVADRSHEKWV